MHTVHMDTKIGQDCAQTSTDHEMERNTENEAYPDLKTQECGDVSVV